MKAISSFHNSSIGFRSITRRWRQEWLDEQTLPWQGSTLVCLTRSLKWDLFNGWGFAEFHCYILPRILINHWWRTTTFYPFGVILPRFIGRTVDYWQVLPLASSSCFFPRLIELLYELKRRYVFPFSFFLLSHQSTNLLKIDRFLESWL